MIGLFNSMSTRKYRALGDDIVRAAKQRGIALTYEGVNWENRIMRGSSDSQGRPIIKREVTLSFVEEIVDPDEIKEILNG